MSPRAGPAPAAGDAASTGAPRAARAGSRRLGGPGTADPGRGTLPPVFMPPTALVALGYFGYLAAIGIVRGNVRARAASLAALVGVAAVEIALTRFEDAAWLFPVRAGWPLLLLFVGYRVAGFHYERADVALERWLLDVDRRVAAWAARVGAATVTADARVRRRWARRAVAGLEAAYLGVYLVIPLGALVVALGESAAAVDRFWTVVLASGFACYGMLPWVQTRPPRLVAPSPEPAPRSRIRRLNLAILEGGSVGVNTLPSGHAATATATALAVAAHAPAAAAALAVAAVLIAIGTVTGRYHYVVDTVLGVLVGVVVSLAVPAA